MSFFENIYISKYKKLLQQIENLNKRNVQGYNTFAEYCYSDEIMIGYFNELKLIERKVSNLRVDSYETFEHKVFEQLKDIYDKRINRIKDDILKNEKIEFRSKEFYKQKIRKLNELREDILNGYGHRCDKFLNDLKKDIDSKIKEANDDYKEAVDTSKNSELLKKEKLELDHTMLVDENQYEFPTLELLDEDDEIKEIIASKEYIDSKSNIILGVKEESNTRIIDINETSHILIAGTTGIGKTTLLDNIILNILYKSKPSETKLVMFDTDNNSLRVYNGIPHLLIPVITDVKKSVGALAWAVQEIENRYQFFLQANTENINDYNEKSDIKLPKIVIIIDEIAEIVKSSKDEVDEILTKITKQGKKVGVFLIISTNRPSSDIVAGSVKANIYTRISFFLPSRLDSKLILDIDGAEKLNGIGDILFKTIGIAKPKEYHCPYISTSGVKKVVDYLKNGGINYNMDILERSDNNNKTELEIELEQTAEYERDPFLMEAIDAVVETGQASTSFIQRRFKVGYARACRIIDQMEEKGVISGYQGSQPRKVLITKERLNEFKNVTEK